MHFFVRSGYTNLSGIDGATLRDFGYGGYYWSSKAVIYTSAASATAYYLGFGIAVNPSYGPSVRWYGFPLRCLSTVLDMERWALGGDTKKTLISQGL